MHAVAVYLASPERLVRHYTLVRVHEKSLKFEIDANEVTKRKLAGFTQVSIYSHSSKTVNTWETLRNVYCFATNQVWDETKRLLPNCTRISHNLTQNNWLAFSAMANSWQIFNFTDFNYWNCSCSILAYVWANKLDMKNILQKYQEKRKVNTRVKGLSHI